MMIKLIKALVGCIFWLWLFAIPAGAFLFISFLLYKNNQNNIFIPALVLLAGMVLGFFLAESVRKKYGLDLFFGKLLATPENEQNNQ